MIISMSWIIAGLAGACAISVGQIGIQHFVQKKISHHIPDFSHDAFSGSIFSDGRQSQKGFHCNGADLSSIRMPF